MKCWYIFETGCTFLLDVDCGVGKKEKLISITKKILVIGFIFTLYFVNIPSSNPKKISQNNGKVNDDVLEIKIDDCDREREPELNIYNNTLFTMDNPLYISPYVGFYYSLKICL